ncbi:oxysterol-binding protein-related protein 1 isoform X2 [Strongylocentrotus purpuratus]|uniref:Oxysterol-binding protein n=1 Tax=Strongylocentrotus purpuratus TaxID=7668 RepID=A0A7M7N3Y9_STRPU|nr:oxysterol-binding protein-related protein 1 isoform X1 [Strongylocentrotus purpuratus]XP_030830791.1 oxysterol-binding protein-related protein 1 isoform X1 [Strongylocentrotus purpuratus]XP_030830793.1 oxysterol-binding protein-related protein 1 isoform X2 [Strongylocentrotus purpuratus]
MAEQSSAEFQDCQDESEQDEEMEDETEGDVRLKGTDQTHASSRSQVSSLRKADLEKVEGLPGSVAFFDCDREEDGGEGAEEEQEKTLVGIDETILDEGSAGIASHYPTVGKGAGGVIAGVTQAHDGDTLETKGGMLGDDDDDKMKDVEFREVEEHKGVDDDDDDDNSVRKVISKEVEHFENDNDQGLHQATNSQNVSGDAIKPEEEKEDTELLLLAARHGDASGVLKLIQKYKQYGENCTFSVNCKGQQKSNRGWNPLHLASYFGHDKAALVLLSNGANINSMNPMGDTPLHKAAYIGREDIVQLLIEGGADVFAVNGEGMSPKEVALGSEVKRLLEGAEQSQQLKSQQTLLHAASEGDLETITKMLEGPRPPNINCTDVSGHTPLHRACCSDQREAAILLLQSGAKTDVKNSKGQTALDLAQSYHIRQLVSLRPMKVVHSYVNKFEGPLYRAGMMRRRHLWVVLDQGMLSYYRNRADAYAGVKRQGCKSLDNADIKVNVDNDSMFAMKYNEGSTHLWMLDEKFSSDLTREKWISALREHRSYSERLASSCIIADSDSDDEEEGENKKKLLALSSIQDTLKNAQTRHHLVEESIRNLSQWMDGLKGDTSNSINLSELTKRLEGIVDRSHEACSALSSCMAVMSGQEELRNLQLRQEQERIRNLQDALHALARQHDRLEVFSASFSASPGLNNFHDTQEFDYDDHEFHSVMDSGSRGSSPTGSFDDRLSDVESFYSVRMDNPEQRSPTEGALVQSRISADSENHSNSKQQSKEDLVVSSNNGDCNITKSRDLGQSDVFTFGSVPNIIIPGCARVRLPAPMYRRDHMTLWTVLKQCIGKELSKITMPVVFNEPLSFLQRCCEYIEHAHLLVKASMSDDPLDRMKYVTAFVVSASASNVDRFGKPFNPLLGETYELSRDDIDTKMLLEQVSHHPPVSAFHASSPHFEFHGAVHPKLKFWGKSMEVQPKGVVTIKLPKHGESYTFHNVLMCVHNLIVGRLWIEQYGTLEIINHKTGLKSVLNFKPAGWFGRDLHKIEGHISDKQGKKLCYLYGKWTEYICAVQKDTPESRKEEKKRKGRASVSEKSPPSSPGAGSDPVGDGPDKDSQILWQNLTRPEESSQYYSFTSFAMRLNEIGEGTKQALPCTDSRLRPDIRLLENGDIDGASSEKHRLEENQRARRKHRNKSKETWSPLWFKADVNSLTGEQDWLYKGTYWDRNYSSCPTIF